MRLMRPHLYTPSNIAGRCASWFEVLRTSGHIEQGKPQHYQVTLKVGFTMEAPI